MDARAAQKRGPRAPLERVPDEVLVTHVAKFLSQGEVVHGLSEANWHLCEVLRRGYGVTVDAFSGERFPCIAAWRKIYGGRFRESWWSHFGVGYEDFFCGVKKFFPERFADVDFLWDLKKRMNELMYREHCPLSCLDIFAIKDLKLRRLEIGKVIITPTDLLFFQSISTLEVLILRHIRCAKGLDVFPPKLKELQVSGHWRNEHLVVQNLPETLQVLHCDRVRIPAQTALPGLKTLVISNVINSNSFTTRFPASLHRSLRKLKVSWLKKLQNLPPLSTILLDSLELSDCPSLLAISELPFSLRRLRIDSCSKAATLVLPDRLAELECIRCDVLCLDITKLPSELRVLTLSGCDKIQETLGSISCLPARLQALKLVGFENLVELLQLPEGLKRLELEYVPRLQEISPFPKKLEHLTLFGCTNVEAMELIPFQLRTLRCSGNFPFRDSNFPETLSCLEIKQCDDFVLNFEALPRGLECLRLDRLDIKSVPFLPLGLKCLDLSDMPQLRALPKLPRTLQELSLYRCQSINSFPGLPPELRSLEIFSCDQLQYVGGDNEPAEMIGFPGSIPQTLKTLYLCRCKRLAKIGVLPLNLSSLDILECRQEPTISSTSRHLMSFNEKDDPPLSVQFALRAPTQEHAATA